MKLDLKFKENSQRLNLKFGQLQDLSDGGYERGYEEGQKVGYANGYTEGRTAGIEQGREAERDRFETAYQSNGNREDYEFAYAGKGWTEEVFAPNHDIRPITAMRMFQGNPMNIDLAQRLEELGVVLDFSNTTNAQYVFYFSRFTRIGVVDFSKSPQLLAVFGYAYDLHTIDKLILAQDGSQTFNAIFSNAVSLENLTIEGTIGQSGFDVKQSNKLSKVSLISIIEHLSSTTNGLTVTVSREAVNKAFETSAGANDGSTSTEWLTLVGTRANWTISLV